MDYIQMTLDDWLSVKNELEEELRGAAAGFVRIGYLLRKIEESKAYERDGYKSLAKWAEATYGLSESSVSRFMDINRKYSIDGYSKQLRLEYARFGQSKLAEMLTLSDEGIGMLTPEMKRQDIRELKRFEKEAPEEAPAEETDECPAWILAFVRENSFDIERFEGQGQGKMIEEIIPSGAKMFRAKECRTMVAFTRDGLSVRVFPNPPENMEWQQFFEAFLPALRKESMKKEVRKLQEAVEEHAAEQVMEKDEQAQEAEKRVREAVREERRAEREEPKAEQEMPKTEREMPKAEQKMPTEPEEVPAKPEEMPAEQDDAPGAESEPEEEKPAEEEQQVAAGAGETLAPAQENPPDIVESNENRDSTIAESEPEQVEIDDILPPPAEGGPLEDIRDRFKDALNSLRIMADAGHFERMEQTINRLTILRNKYLYKKSEMEEMGEC